MLRDTQFRSPRLGFGSKLHHYSCFDVIDRPQTASGLENFQRPWMYAYFKLLLCMPAGTTQKWFMHNTKVPWLQACNDANEPQVHAVKTLESNIAVIFDQLLLDHRRFLRLPIDVLYIRQHLLLQFDESGLARMLTIKLSLISCNTHHSLHTSIFHTQKISCLIWSYIFPCFDQKLRIHGTVCSRPPS